MKKTAVMLLGVVLVFLLPVCACAAETEDDIYANIWSGLAPEIKQTLEGLGVEKLDARELMEISPARVFSMLRNMFSGEFSAPLKTAAVCFMVILAAAFISNFFPDNSAFKDMGESVGVMCVMFSLISSAGSVFADCCSALEMSNNFMLSLIPVLAGIITVSGKPSLAVSVNGMFFGFAQWVAWIFQKAVPVLSVSASAAAAASSLNPMMKFSGIGRVIPKTASLLMGFLSSVFAGVLSIRGIIAGAADTAAVKGLRFIVGSTVPVVGSAIGDALSSVAAGLGLIRHTVGIFGVAAAVTVVLPAAAEAVMWKLSLFFLAAAADMFDSPRIKTFAENMSGVLSILLAAMFFTVFVFVVSIAVLINIGGD